MDKAYIVANKQQEREVLNDLERQGIKWVSGGENPTAFTPKPIQFPYGLFTDDEGHLQWGNMRSLEDEEIVYDGREEEKMSEKYVVSQEFMDALVDWKHDTAPEKDFYITPFDFKEIPFVVKSWWLANNVDSIGNNNRLIAIIKWINGEDVFEVEKPKKWIVRSKEHDGQYFYGKLLLANNNTVFMGYSFANATRFDTKEEAESWANSHQEVVEVEE